MKLFDTINVYLFIEDKKKYININSIKINITEDGSPYVHNTSISIECVFNENMFNEVLSLSLLKYENLMQENGLEYNFRKKDLVSDIILYVSKTNSYHDTNNLLKIMELKNVMITGFNTEENTVMLICDYYIRFNDYLEITDKDYLENIFNLININYNKSYTTPYLYMPYLDYTSHEIENNSNDYEENYDYDDWEDYEEDQDNIKVDNIFDKSSKLVSKIFSSFYK